MSQQRSGPAAVRVWKLIYVVIVGCVLLYLAGWAADTKLLAAQVAIARISGKEHRDMKQTYSMERIGNVTRAVPRVIPEAYVLKLRLENKDVEWPVEKDYFRNVEIGQQLRVRFEQRCITGSLRVISLESE
jgi:hypothetical protein